MVAYARQMGKANWNLTPTPQPDSVVELRFLISPLHSFLKRVYRVGLAAIPGVASQPEGEREKETGACKKKQKLKEIAKKSKRDKINTGKMCGNPRCNDGKKTCAFMPCPVSSPPPPRTMIPYSLCRNLAIIVDYCSIIHI